MVSIRERLTREGGADINILENNFNLDNPESGHYPCSRYATATQMLSEITNENDLTISACAAFFMRYIKKVPMQQSIVIASILLILIYTLITEGNLQNMKRLISSQN